LAERSGCIEPHAEHAAARWSRRAADEAREVLRRARGEGGRTVLPMTAGQIRAAGQAAVTPAQRLAIALAAVHAARPQAIRELTLDDIDLPSRRITLAGHR
jgi:hypothetical protein